MTNISAMKNLGNAQVSNNREQDNELMSDKEFYKHPPWILNFISNSRLENILIDTNKPAVLQIINHQ